MEEITDTNRMVKIEEGLKSRNIKYPKINQEKLDSFFFYNEYNNSNILHHEIGSAIIEISVAGDIVIAIGDHQYANMEIEEAIEKYELTNEKMCNMEANGELQWINNNWFEISITNDQGRIDDDVDYNYLDALENFITLIEEEESKI